MIFRFILNFSLDGVPYACQFDGRPMLVRSHDDLFTVTLHPPCPTVSNKLDAPQELLAKLGLRPMSLLPTATAIPRGPGPAGAMSGSGTGGAGVSTAWRVCFGLRSLLGSLRQQQQQQVPKRRCSFFPGESSQSEIATFRHPLIGFG